MCSLVRRCDKLKCQLQSSRNDHVIKLLDNVTCTKGTTACNRQVTGTLPTQVRKLPWSSLSGLKVCVGKGVFGKCYLVEIGPINACLKIFRSESKYSSTFFNEIRMLLQLSHCNVPWLYGVQYDVKHPKAIAMLYHPFCGGNESTTVHSALKRNEFHEKIQHTDWKDILTGVTAALDYLCRQKILHNDIKGDNVIIEYLPPDYKSCRSVLIDFGKACYASEAMLYTLSAEQKEIYKKCHPQIAPEVRNGVEKQSYCSDMYSFGRVLNQINAEILKTPVLYNMAEQCLDYCSQKRPAAKDLHKFLTNLFH